MQMRRARALKHLRWRYDLQLPPPRHVNQLRLVPQLLWPGPEHMRNERDFELRYDKPHMCRTRHYLEAKIAGFRPFGASTCF